MHALDWTDDLRLGLAPMDDTHRAFVACLRALQDALPGPRPGALAAAQALLAHCQAHFAQEEGWMAALGFDAANCHARQHAVVLGILREATLRAERDADWEPLTILAHELALWFPQHAQAMDAALAEVMAATAAAAARREAAAA